MIVSHKIWIIWNLKAKHIFTIYRQSRLNHLFFKLKSVIVLCVLKSSDIAHERIRVIRDTKSNGRQKFWFHHLSSLIDLLFVRFKISFNILFKHSFVQTLKVFIWIEVTENFFVGYASEPFETALVLIFKGNLVWVKICIFILRLLLILAQRISWHNFSFTTLYFISLRRNGSLIHSHMKSSQFRILVFRNGQIIRIRRHLTIAWRSQLVFNRVIRFDEPLLLKWHLVCSRPLLHYILVQSLAVIGSIR